MQTTLSNIPYRDLLFDSSVAIGEGAVGSVYKATHRSVTVAVKVTSDYTVDVGSLRREVELYDLIGRQENVATLFGVCTDAPDGRLRLVMEYCELGSLDTWLASVLRPGSADEKVSCIELIVGFCASGALCFTRIAGFREGHSRFELAPSPPRAYMYRYYGYIETTKRSEFVTWPLFASHVPQQRL
jgi:hypothetical protein